MTELHPPANTTPESPDRQPQPPRMPLMGVELEETAHQPSVTELLEQGSRLAEKVEELKLPKPLRKEDQLYAVFYDYASMTTSYDDKPFMTQLHSRDIGKKKNRGYAVAELSPEAPVTLGFPPLGGAGNMTPEGAQRLADYARENLPAPIGEVVSSWRQYVDVKPEGVALYTSTMPRIRDGYHRYPSVVHPHSLHATYQAIAGAHAEGSVAAATVEDVFTPDGIKRTYLSETVTGTGTGNISDIRTNHEQITAFIPYEDIPADELAGALAAVGSAVEQMNTEVDQLAGGSVEGEWMVRDKDWRLR
jgi:hypothetical protein